VKEKENTTGTMMAETYESQAEREREQKWRTGTERGQKEG
jgi:hypothetical protein